MKILVFLVVLLLSALALKAAPVTNYFLVGEFLHFDDGRGTDPRDYPAPKLSFVVPIVDPEHLIAVRKEVALRPRLIPVADREQLVFSLNVVPTPDGLNRNYDLAGFPEWGWHVTGLHDYAYGGGIATQFFPSLRDLECTARGTCPGMWPGLFDSPWYSIARYTFVEELGPHPLFVRHQVEEDSVRRIRLDWNVPPGGTAWNYTVEQPAGTAGAEWTPVPGTGWPTTNTSFTLPVTHSSAMLRVVARDSAH